ncbi:hypothetical protein WA026_001224 [Henosepilachna vigintioctopunctata]|uniref:Uncharacterized protein n=1 Tax=Henosepilachna vigintioctopunctata TaxID=420089 RepID=A0AAW1UQH9_9CUCU
MMKGENETDIGLSLALETFFDGDYSEIKKYSVVRYRKEQRKPIDRSEKNRFPPCHVFHGAQKVQSSESGIGTGTEDVYVPNWENYNELRFLSNVQRATRAETDSLGTPLPSPSSYDLPVAKNRKLAIRRCSEVTLSRMTVSFL